MATTSPTQSQAPPLAAALTASSTGNTDTVAVPPLTSSFVDVPLSRLKSSKTNPRKHFDGPDMLELIESVRQKGVLMPILVRDSGWRTPEFRPGSKAEIEYEVVAGERRYRAAQAAGLNSIPARIAALSDQEVLEIQIIENLQRKDVTALEEADGYARLFKQMQVAQLKAAKQDLIAEIAKKIGKSVRYVYARMKLTELHEDVKAALAAGEIPASHADELVRLKPLDQKKALKESCFRSEWIAGKDVRNVVSVRLLKERLAGFYRELSGAPWKHDDAVLLPLAGACDSCPKNTANQPDFDGKKKLCVDQDCYGKKLDAFVQITLIKAQKPGESKPIMLDAQYPHGGYKGAVDHWKWSANIVKAGSCKHQQVGVIVAGPETGHRRTVCLDDKCKVHHSGNSQGSLALGGSRPQQPSPEERRREEEARKHKRAAQQAVFFAGLDRIKDLSGRVVDLLIERAFFNADIYEEHYQALGDYFGLKVGDSWNGFETAVKKAQPGMTQEAKARLLFMLLHAEHLEDFHSDSLNKVAKGLGVDIAKVREQAIAKLKAAAQTSAKEAKSSGARKPEAAKAKPKPKTAQAKGKKGGRK
jgi:ParB family chromosome partitioning protein